MPAPCFRERSMEVVINHFHQVSPSGTGQWHNSLILSTAMPESIIFNNITYPCRWTKPQIKTVNGKKWFFHFADCYPAAAGLQSIMFALAKTCTSYNTDARLTVNAIRSQPTGYSTMSH